MKELKRILKPLKNRMVLHNVILRLMQSMAVGIAAVFVVLVASKLTYIPDKALICAAVLATAVIVGIILAFTKYKITDYNAAETGDRLGCNERLITAYGILEKNGEKTPMEKLAVEDAVKTAKQTDLVKKYKMTFPKRLAIVLVVALGASCLTGFAPDKGVYKLSAITKNALEETDKIKETINKDERLSEGFKKEYNEIIKNLNKDLKRAKDSKEAKKLINEAQRELKKLEKKSLDDKNSIKNALSDYSAGQDISAAMDTGNSEALAKAMEKLAAELDKLTDEELKQLAEQLGELADNLSDEELAELLEEAAKAAEEGDIEKLAKAVSSAASSAMTKASAASSAANRTASSLAKASDGTGKTATSTPNSSASQNGNGTGEGEGQGEGQGNGEGQGQGEGQGNGEGNGNGNGNGSGQGNGQGGNGTGTGGNGRGFGHAEPEKVYTMNASGLSGEEEQLNSQQTEQGQVSYSETRSDGSKGESVPYDSVVGQYKDKALAETENGNIPYGMKQIIAEYFSALS